jgi:pentatricopeptide repeat protein
MTDNPSRVREEVAAYRTSPAYGDSLITFNAALRCLLLTREPDGRIDEILQLYNDILEHGLQLNSSTYALIIEALCDREREVSHLMAINRQKERESMEAASASLWSQPGFRERYPQLAAQDDVWTKSEKPEDVKFADDYLPSVEKMFRALGRRTEFLGTIALNRILAVTATRPDKVNLAISVFAALETSTRAETAPDAFSYLHLIGAHAKAGDLQGARTVFDAYVEARKKGDVPAFDVRLKPETSGIAMEPWSKNKPTVDESVWNRMIVTSISCGDAEAAIALVERMTHKDRSQEVPPIGSSTLEVVVGGFIKTGDLESAMRWFDRIVSEASSSPAAASSSSASSTSATLPKPSDTFFSNAIGQLLDGGSIDLAEHVFAAFSAHVSTESVHLNRAYARLVDHHLSKAIKPDVSAIEANKSLDTIQRFRQEMKVDHRRRLSYPQARRLIGALALHGRYGDASTIYQDLVLSVVVNRDGALLENLFQTTPYVALGVAYPPVTQAAKPSLSAVLGVAWGLQEGGQRPRGLIATMLVESYLAGRGGEERGFDRTSWAILVDAFAIVSVQVAQGAQLGFEFPGFQIIADDLVRSGVSLSGKADLRHAAKSLVDAIGPERASAAFSAIDSKVANLIARDFQPEDFLGPADPLVLPTTSESPEGGSSASGTRSTDLTPPPTPPQYLSQLRPEVNVVERIDPSLSKTVSNMEHRPLEAFKRVTTAAAEGRLTHPASIGRVIESFGHVQSHIVAKDDSLEKIHELYLIGYSALQCVREAEAARFYAWVELEDRMIIALAYLGELGKVAVHRDRLIANGSAPSADAYGAMIINARETTDDASVALELFGEARRLKVRPSTFLYNTLISKLSKARRSTLALEYFSEMKALQLPVSAITYGSIINACCKTGDEAMAVELFNEMTGAPDFHPRVPPYNTMIQYFVSKGNREQALSYFDAMLRVKVKPSEHTYKLLLDAYGMIEPADPASMMDVFGRLAEEQNHLLRVNGAHWASLINAWGGVQKDVDRAISLFESIPSHPTTKHSRTPLPDALVYEALFNVFISNDRHDLVETYIARMKQNGVRMTAYVVNSLIRVRPCRFSDFPLC